MSAINAYHDRFVTLRNGLIVPTGAYLLLLDLERRGCHVKRDDDVLVVGPSDLLNDEDRGAIRRWKFHLLLLMENCTGQRHDAHLFSDATPDTDAARRHCA